MEEEAPLKIHSCEELPSIQSDLSRDEDCLKLVEATYLALKWRGGGQHGIALETTTTYGTPGRSQRMVIKIGRINAAELRIVCELNSLVVETPVFPHTYGWLVCHVVPEPWLRAIGTRGKKHELFINPPDLYLFTFVQAVDESWDTFSFGLNDNSYRSALFFLLHGLYVARQRIGFQHGDIHSGNVMI
jgi:hypothetical protein